MLQNSERFELKSLDAEIANLKNLIGMKKESIQLLQTEIQQQREENENQMAEKDDIIHSLESQIEALHEQVSDNAVEQSNDAPQFKGIFMRYLMYFYQNVILTDQENKYLDMK